MTSPGSPSATFLPGSEDGPTPSTSLAGHEPEPCGPPPVPVSRFRALDSDRELPTSDTCGLLFSVSSPSYDLQSCLENRLRVLLGGSGSPEYVLTWSTWDMPAGLPICRLRASGPRTSDSASTSPPTGWPTPKAERPDQDTTYPRGNPTLGRVAGWATPTQMDHARVHSEESTARSCETGAVGESGKRGLDLGMQAQMAGWPTPTESTGGPEPEGETGRKLVTVAQTAGWGTPTAADAKDGPQDPNGERSQLKDQVHGVSASGSPAEMEKRGVLNPEFSRWLMGFPAGWSDFAASV